MAEVLATGEPQRFESRTGSADLVTSMYPVADDDGHVHHVAVFIQDVTDQKQREEADRLAAVGQLSGGVAHEFNNVLAGIMLLAERAERARTTEAYEDLTERAQALAKRGATVARNLTAFAQQHASERGTVAIDDVIGTALAATNAQTLEAGVRTHRQSCETKAEVIGNSAELGRVFVNLVLNACHAMPEGGSLSIRTETVSGGTGQQVLVTVTDTGNGIAPRDLPHVFEPFFTTTGVLGGGAETGPGLGLSVAYGIVTAHGGSIEAMSEPGGGMRFEVRLPQAEIAAVPPAQTCAADDSDESEGGVKVLLAEDETEIGRLVAQVLERQGHTVTHVASGEEAIAALGRERFGLVITDLLMPGTSGLDVVKCLQTLPEVPPTMVITGHIGDQLAAELQTQGVRKCLRKPFGVGDFLRAVAEVLGEV